MFVVIVQANVKPESIQAFIIATLDNASNSVQEPGVARFDFYQQSDDPTRFTLIEIYRSDDAPNKHRNTAHYARWRDAVVDMLAEPRTKVTYDILYPPLYEL
ncbi:MAG: antibiotic biosynthesis monooxygenase [Chloroflexi bacterium RBG_16_47_49]|nr:MAG: antibiotic biosynthesis monooxygenase [Chloroflexi bacterium RBG_16_47_49]